MSQTVAANATNHYAYYPTGEFPVFLAYGFRPMFLVMVPYMVLSIVLWAFYWSGILPLSFLGNPLEWHIYELLFGVGTGGVIAFILTGLPELFPGVVPIVGRRLALMIGLWVVGRLSFWGMDLWGIWVVALCNLPLLGWIIAIAFKPVVLDKQQRHASIAYTIVIIFGIQAYYFGVQAGVFEGDSMATLKLALGAFMALTILALRRVNTEAINEWLEDRGIDDLFLARPPRYNLAVFCIALFTCIEFFWEANSILGWVGLATMASIFGILSELKMKDSVIIFEPYVLYLSTIPLIMGLGYGLMGYSYLDPTFIGVNHFRHFLTTGAFGLAFFMVLVIVTYVHSGRHLQAHWSVTVGVLLLLSSTFMRGFIPFFEDLSSSLYMLSALFWAAAFALYYICFRKFLLSPRADGIKG